jgi:hypothetical protein
MGIIEKATHSDYVAAQPNTYEVGLYVEFENKDAEHQYTTVKVTPCLRNIGFTEKRYRHWWNVHYITDGNYQGSEYKLLPDGDSGITNVVNKGYGFMDQGIWYQWGPTKEYKHENDGKGNHSVGVYLHCTATTPRYCPALVNGEQRYVTYTFSLPKYNPHADAPTPSGVDCDFDKSTRTLYFKWNTAGCASVKVYIDMYRKDDSEYSQGYLKINGTENFKPEQGSDNSVYVKIPPEVASIKYRVYNVSTSGDTEGTDLITVYTPTNDKVWMNIPGVGWKKTIPWVKDENGKWHKATKTYVKDNGTWKRTIM